METALRVVQSDLEEHYRLLLKHTSDALLLHDTSGTVLMGNRALAELLGCQEDQLAGRQYCSVDVRTDPGELRARWAQLEPGTVVYPRGAFQRNDGKVVAVQTRVAVELVQGERIFIVSAQQGTEAGAYATLEAAHQQLLLTQRELRASEKNYRTLYETSPYGIFVHDWDTGRILEANPAGLDMLRYSLDELRDRKGRDLHPATELGRADLLNQELQSQGCAKARLQMCRKDERLVWVDMTVSRYSVNGTDRTVAVVEDVTSEVERAAELEASILKLQEAQAQLLHADRLMATGQLAAGVAHEINNPAGYVLSNLAVLKERLDELGAEEELRRLISESVEGLDRIRAIVRDLKTFGRVERDCIEEVDLNDILRSACSVTANEVRHRATLHIDLAELPSIAADRGKLGQVFVNLLVNAAQAITEGRADVNRITVRTTALPGQLVAQVIDTGHGIPEELRSRIFDPFFTTKPTDEGTGLGLSLSAEIVRKHGGRIELQSSERGTTFSIYLPRDTGLKVTRAARAPLSPPQRRSMMPVGRARVLVVDDEPLLLRAYRRVLASKHEIVTAAGGQEALEVLRERSDFHVVLCDLMMPQVDGPMVYDSICEHYPHLADRIIFCSGGAFTGRAKTFAENVQTPILEKPVDKETLLSVIADRKAALSE